MCLVITTGMGGKIESLVGNGGTLQTKVPEPQRQQRPQRAWTSVGRQRRQHVLGASQILCLAPLERRWRPQQRLVLHVRFRQIGDIVGQGGNGRVRSQRTGPAGPDHCHEHKLQLCRALAP